MPICQQRRSASIAVMLTPAPATPKVRIAGTDHASGATGLEVAPREVVIYRRGAGLCRHHSPENSWGNTSLAVGVGSTGEDEHPLRRRCGCPDVGSGQQSPIARHARRRPGLPVRLPLLGEQYTSRFPISQSGFHVAMCGGTGQSRPFSTTTDRGHQPIYGVGRPTTVPVGSCLMPAFASRAHVLTEPRATRPPRAHRPNPPRADVSPG